jgi:hypothetical protein
VLILENYYSPDELADQLDLLIEYYNNDRYHEALQNLTPADVYYGRSRDILSRRKRIKKWNLKPSLILMPDLSKTF